MTNRGRKRLYDPDERIEYIFSKVWEYGSVKNAAKHIESHQTGNPLTPSAIREYLKKYGYKIVSRPYLIDEDDNIIRPIIKEI